MDPRTKGFPDKKKVVCNRVRMTVEYFGTHSRDRVRLTYCIITLEKRGKLGWNWVDLGSGEWDKGGK